MLDTSALQVKRTFAWVQFLCRIFPNGEVQYLHPKDGVYPEKVNAGREPVGKNDRSIGQNTNPVRASHSSSNQSPICTFLIIAVIALQFFLLLRASGTVKSENQCMLTREGKKCFWPQWAQEVCLDCMLQQAYSYFWSQSLKLPCFSHHRVSSLSNNSFIVISLSKFCRLQGSF